MTMSNFQMRPRAARLVWQAAPWERFEARGVIASALALAALTAAATAGGATAAGVISSHGASSAAEIQAKATETATQQQLEYEREALAASTKASADSLAYTEGQAKLNRQDAETNREGNYDQWAAREGRLSTIGGMLGMPARQIPAFKPLGPDGTAGGAGATTPGNPAQMPKQGEIDWTAPPDKLGQQLTAYFQSRGVPANEVPYWVQQASPLVTRGQQLGDPLYADKRLAAADIFGAGGAGASSTGVPPPGSISAISSAKYQPQTPAYMAPPITMPGSIRSIAA